MTDRFRLVLIGTKHPHSAPYQHLLAHMPEVEAVAIFDDGGEVIAPYRGLPVFRSLDELIKSVSFDGALVTVPNDRAVTCIVPLIAAGKHVFADKPVCRNAKEMRRILAAVEEAGITFAVGYQNRFQPAHERALALIRQGELGRIVAVQGYLMTTDVESRDPTHFLFDKDTSGGGVLHWLGCHVLDLMLDVVGSPPVEVSGHLSTFSGAAIDVEEVGVVSMRFGCGAVGAMMAGYTIPFSSDTPYVDSPKETLLTVWGTEGRLAYEPMGSRLEIERYRPQIDAPLKEAFTFALPPFPGYTGWLGKRMIEDFVAGVREGRPPRAGAYENMRVLEVLDALYDRSRVPTHEGRRTQPRELGEEGAD